VEKGRPLHMDIELIGLPEHLDLFGRFVRLRIKWDWNGREHLLSELFDDIPVEIEIPEFEIVINATPDNFRISTLTPDPPCQGTDEHRKR
jgi:hypothetical protein